MVPLAEVAQRQIQPWYDAEQLDDLLDSSGTDTVRAGL